MLVLFYFYFTRRRRFTFALSCVHFAYFSFIALRRLRKTLRNVLALRWVGLGNLRRMETRHNTTTRSLHLLLSGQVINFQLMLNISAKISYDVTDNSELMSSRQRRRSWIVFNLSLCRNRRRFQSRIAVLFILGLFILMLFLLHYWLFAFYQTMSFFAIVPYVMSTVCIIAAAFVRGGRTVT